jgi:peptide/nickel transport system substrate-binding protein
MSVPPTAIRLRPRRHTGCPGRSPPAWRAFDSCRRYRSCWRIPSDITVFQRVPVVELDSLCLGQVRLRAHGGPTIGIVGALLLVASCGPRGGCGGGYCGTLVFAAPGEPTTLLPVVTDEALDRDVFDQLFLKLADIGPDANTIGDKGFEPELAAHWEWTSPLALTFHLDPRARWHDGEPVTSADVAFTFGVYTDSAVDSPYRSNLGHIISVKPTDAATVTYTFDHRYPEMFFDAVYHMRILPAHLLKTLEHSAWRSAPFGRMPVGDGPYRFVRWTPGQSIELAADSTFFLGRPHLRRLIWRFTTDLTVGVTQVVAGEADAIQVLVTPANIDRAAKSGHLTLYPYAGSVYNLLGFNLRANGDRMHPHPIFGDADVRRALVLATDRVKMAQSVFGGHAKIPPGPISQMWRALWFADIPVPAYDTTQAAQLLEHGGWHRASGDAVRARNGVKLSFHLAVPSTSGTRKQYAQLIQEQLRAVGVEVVIDEMESATMHAKQRAGTYDAALESWSTDPSPSSSIRDAWTHAGGSNFGGYNNPAFDQQIAQAISADTPDQATQAWHEALLTLAHDSPAIMLYALDNVAAVDRRVADVRLRPDYWWAFVRSWRIPPDRLADRDRVEH